MNTDELENNTPGFLRSPKSEYRWYVLEIGRSDMPEWQATCWSAPTEKEALELRKYPGYHTQFHSDKLQVLIKETLSFCECPEVQETSADGYRLTDGVPDSFVGIGVGYGFRVNFIEGKRGWVLSFPSDKRVVVRTFEPEDQRKLNGNLKFETQDIEFSFDEFLSKVLGNL